MSWVDATSYRRGERGKIEPETWAQERGRLRLIVTRLLSHDGWFAACYPMGIREVRLKSIRADQAKAEAVGVLRKRIAELSALVEEFEES